MDKNQPFFDPYNFNTQQPNITHQPGMTPDIPMSMDPPMNPVMYYEQQYMYYKYLTQMLEYKMKLKEWENLTKK